MNEHNEMPDMDEIRKLIQSGKKRAEKPAAWFFILWGTIWLSGFSFTQYLPDRSHLFWIPGNILGVLTTIILIHRFYGKGSSVKNTVAGKKILGISAGILIFDIVIIGASANTSPEFISLVMIMSAGLCYFMLGIFVNPEQMIIGILVTLPAAAAFFLFRDFFYLVTGIGAGSVLIGNGIRLLSINRKSGKTDG